MYAVDAQALCKDYRRAFRPPALALAGLDLQVPLGSAFGLIGLNGAGKTTFIKTILAVVRPTSGTIRVLGGSPEDPEVRARVGYLPERSYFPPSANALAYLRSIAALKKLRLADQALRQQLERVELAGVDRQRVSTFSKGMKQRLGLAAALLGQPELLLLDEPTDGIDPLGRLAVRRILAEERARGATILLNSHLLLETERTCDHVAILHRGRVLTQGPLESLGQATSSWRLRVAAPLNFEAAAGLEGIGPLSYRLSAPDPAALNAILDRLRSGGAMIVELAPEAQDLEQLLERLVRPKAA